jgi:quinol monooxygenase YgiN
MVHVLALIQAKAGKRAQILQAFKDNMPAVLAEQGCIEYQPVIDSAAAPGFAGQLGDDSFAVIEKWETMDALAAHAAAPHMASYAAKVKDLIESRVVHVMENA